MFTPVGEENFFGCELFLFKSASAESGREIDAKNILLIFVFPQGHPLASRLFQNPGVNNPDKKAGVWTDCFRTDIHL